MTFRVRHEWPANPTRLLSAELVSCPHCHVLRVTEAGKLTRYLRRLPNENQSGRDSETEPPCIEPPPPPRRATGRGNPLALERAFRDALDRGRVVRNTHVCNDP